MDPQQVSETKEQFMKSKGQFSESNEDFSGMCKAYLGTEVFNEKIFGLIQ